MRDKLGQVFQAHSGLCTGLLKGGEEGAPLLQSTAVRAVYEMMSQHCLFHPPNSSVGSALETEFLRDGDLPIVSRSLW